METAMNYQHRAWRRQLCGKRLHWWKVDIFRVGYGDVWDDFAGNAPKTPRLKLLHAYG